MAQYTLHEHDGLDAQDLAPNPLIQLQRWIEQARDAGMLEPVAACLATASTSGQPSARIVLIRQVSEQAVAFYTNHDSRKGVELAENPQAALCFWWDKLQRQVRVEGSVTRMSQDEAEVYFQGRPRGSQIGAWASRQSQRVENRTQLEDRVVATAEQFGDEAVPIPDFWGGYWLRPQAVEFWQGRNNRLHDRLRFTGDSTGWNVERLEP